MTWVKFSLVRRSNKIVSLDLAPFGEKVENHCCTIFNHPVVGKIKSLRLKSQQPTIISELQLNLQKHVNTGCGSVNKISMKRKKLLQDKFDQTINLDLMINSDLFLTD